MCGSRCHRQQLYKIKGQNTLCGLCVWSEEEKSAPSLGALFTLHHSFHDAFLPVLVPEQGQSLAPDVDPGPTGTQRRIKFTLGVWQFLQEPLMHLCQSQKAKETAERDCKISFSLSLSLIEDVTCKVVNGEE